MYTWGPGPVRIRSRLRGGLPILSPDASAWPDGDGFRVAGIAGALGGCGSSAVVVDPLARAANETANVGGAHTQLSARIEGMGLPQPVSIEGGGYFNFSSHEGTLSVQLTGFPSATGHGSQPTIRRSTRARTCTLAPRCSRASFRPVPSG